MPEPELINHAGLDSAVYVRIYLLGLKIFVPLTVLAFIILVPVNWGGGTLERLNGLTFHDIDKLSISNVSPGSKRIPRTVGVSIPMKATFFITYIMVDGWTGIAAEIIRLKPLMVFHLKNTFLVKTEQDREQAMDPGSLEFATCEPRIQLYFLLGLVYTAVTPILLPFIVVFFALSYIVFRHQIIYVYNQEYESGAAFWPDVQCG